MSISVFGRMRQSQEVEIFLQVQETDLTPSILVYGEVDKDQLSTRPPDLAQVWRFLQIMRVEILDLKECVEGIGKVGEGKRQRKNCREKSI